MESNEASICWTEKDVEERLNDVRTKLLSFLRERTRLDWFKHKVRWRLSRSYIWPGAPDDFKQRLDDAVEEDVGVEAFMRHLDQQKSAISQAIERYNWALRRWMEQERGTQVNQFDEASKEILHRRRITFEGIHDELLGRAEQLTSESGPELIPELLSLRLAILNEDVRDQLFTEVAATLASRKADEQPDMSPEEREVLAFEIELRLRCCDQFHVAHLLAESYQEAKRLMGFDHLLDRYQQEGRRISQTPHDDPFCERRIKVIREVLMKKMGYLESIYPRSKGTHDRVMAILREVPDSGDQPGD